MKEIQIFLIGCGGTGGCLFGRLIRFLADRPNNDIQIDFSLIDGDHVELKNLGRQPFLKEDIGENKALALSLAAADTLHYNVTAFPEYLSDKNVHRILGKSTYDKNLIVIGAVDNHACRKVLHNFFMKTTCNYLYYIDAANEFHSGDVVFAKKSFNQILAPDRCHYFPEVLKDTEKPVYEKSCEELNVSEPQHLATNSFAADMIFSYLVQLLAASEAVENIPGGIAYFDAFKLFSRFDVYSEERHGKIRTE